MRLGAPVDARGETIAWARTDSPVGPTVVACRGGAVVFLGFVPEAAHAEGVLRAALGRRFLHAALREQGQAIATVHDRIWTGRGPVEVELRGSAFERAVWTALLRLGRGETTSYGAIARALGRPGAARAVGGAVGRNPVSLLVPCHRVLGAGGQLGGYRWGSAIKRALLEAEGFTV